MMLDGVTMLDGVGYWIVVDTLGLCWVALDGVRWCSILFGSGVYCWIWLDFVDSVG